jgi:hypothetical protein
MKTKLLMLVAVYFSVVAAALAKDPREGLYTLSGTNPTPAADKAYKGKVAMRKVEGIYHLVWIVGDAQTQSGVAIVEGSVMSVGYVDTSGRDMGVVSFRILSDKKLEGKWSSIAGTGQGTEVLEYEGPLPKDLRIDPPKEKQEARQTI